MALSIPNLPSITGILNIPGISTGLLAFLQTHGYWIMFFIMIVEGPIVTYVAAFASSLGIFNIYLVLLLSILGNIAGDAFLFFIGRMGKKLAVEKYARRFIGKDRIDRIEKYLKSNPGKTLVVIKLTPPLPVPGLIISGALNIPSKTFFFYPILLRKGVGLGDKLSYEEYYERIGEISDYKIKPLPLNLQGRRFAFSIEAVKADTRDVEQEKINKITEQLKQNQAFSLTGFLSGLQKSLPVESRSKQRAFQFILNSFPVLLVAFPGNKP